MAFCILLRSAACVSRMQSRVLQPLILPSKVVKISLSQLASVNKTTTPILNAVRQFRTTAVNKSMMKDHSKLWFAERILSAALLPLVPLALLIPCKPLDYALAIAVVTHTFWGLEAIAVDYARPIVLGPVLPKVALGLVYAVCIATLGGLFYIINKDIGLANSIKSFWAIKSKTA